MMKIISMILLLTAMVFSLELVAKEQRGHREYKSERHSRNARPNTVRKTSERKSSPRVHTEPKSRPQSTYKAEKRVSSRKPITMEPVEGFSHSERRVSEKSYKGTNRQGNSHQRNTSRYSADKDKGINKRITDTRIKGQFNNKTKAHNHQNSKRYSDVKNKVRKESRHQSRKVVSQQHDKSRYHKDRNTLYKGEKRLHRSFDQRQRDFINHNQYRKHSRSYHNHHQYYANRHFRGHHRYSRWHSGHGHYHYDYHYRHYYNPYRWYDDYYYRVYFDYRWNHGHNWHYGLYYNNYHDPYYCPDGFAKFVTGLTIGALIYSW